MPLPIKDAAKCPYCDGPVTLRFGVRFPPKLGLILDMIDYLGAKGCSMEELVAMFFPGRPQLKGRKNASVSITQINELLTSTDVRVVSDGCRPPVYRIKKLGRATT